MSYTRNSNHKEAGFTLIEILNVIVIIGILGAVGIPQFSQYKNKAYDIHAKRALKDMHLLCNAFWIDTYPSQACDLPTIKGTYYGFNQNPDVLATLPPAPSDTFCATAKHDSSPNVFSINNVSLISSGEKCGVSIVNASFSPRPEYICAGTFQDPCPTIACDEDCTKQKAQDRLLAVINGLPDLMKPSSDDIDKSIQEIQSRTYSDDSDGTPTMNENSSINEILAATMETPPPPPPPPENQFAKVDPVTGETTCTKIPLEYHKLDDDQYHQGNRNLPDDAKAKRENGDYWKGKSSTFNTNHVDGLCVYLDDTSEEQREYVAMGPVSCEAENNCVRDKPECAAPAWRECKSVFNTWANGCIARPGMAGRYRAETTTDRKARGCGNHQHGSGSGLMVTASDDGTVTPRCEHHKRNPAGYEWCLKRSRQFVATIENFVQNSGVEIVTRRYNTNCNVTRNIIRADGTSGNQTVQTGCRETID